MFIIVDAFEGIDSGDFDLEITDVEPCGNAVIDRGEECDDGNATSADGCTACRADSCAVGQVIALDSTTTSTTANSSTEFGFSSFDVCGALGNEIIFSYTPMTERTFATVQSMDTPRHTVYFKATCEAAPAACNSTTTQQNPVRSKWDGPAGTPVLVVVDSPDGGGPFHLNVGQRRCGDGVAEDGEACDDGNNNDGDGCSATCGNEACLAPIVLSDGDTIGNTATGRSVFRPSCSAESAKELYYRLGGNPNGYRVAFIGQVNLRMAQMDERCVSDIVCFNLFDVQEFDAPPGITFVVDASPTDLEFTIRVTPL